MVGTLSDDMFVFAELIATARRITGIDPGYERLHCTTCGFGIPECSCEQDAKDDAAEDKGTADREESN